MTDFVGLLVVNLVNMITRENIIKNAIRECLIETYKWAQPSINLEEYLNNPELIKEDDKDKFYLRYYLSQENLKYLVYRFKNAYNIGSKWEYHIDLLLDYITSKDSVKIIYIEGKDGFPGHKGYKPIIPLNNLTEDYEDVISLIKTCKEFYRRDIESERFNMAVYLGASPNSCKEQVEKYWREHGKPNFTIKDFKIEDIEYSEKYATVDDFIETLK